MASAASTVSNSPILEVLHRYNYKRWRSRMKTYFLVEDLWEAVEAIREPAAKPRDDDKLEYDAWKKKNVKALYAIQNSCGPEMYHFVGDTETAKSAWDALERFSILTGRVENSAENFEPYIEFTKFVGEGNWDKAKECLKLKQLDLHSALRAIDPRDEYGDTAIHVAARSGYVHIVKELMLLLTREDLKIKNAKGSTALHLAAHDGRLEIVKQLVLLMGEEIDNDGDTAIHYAVYNEKVDIVKELVQYMRPKHLKIKNNNGYTALHLAVKKRNELIVKALAAWMGEVRGPDGNTALHVAAKMGAVGLVKELVMLMTEKGLAIKNDEGYTALHLAVNKGNVPIIKVFMTKEKERDFSSYIQFTNYVTKGEWDNAKECLAKLEDINPCDAITVVDPRDGVGDTALHVAARQGHMQIVRELISLLKVRQESLELKTIENIAAFGSGINLGVSEEEVMEKAKYMVEQYEKLVASILEVQNTHGSTPLHIAALNGNAGIVNDLVPLMRKEGLQIQDKQGFTALHDGIYKGNIDIVKVLAPMMRQEGLELKTTKNGYNALHLAIMNGHMDIAKEVMPFMRKEALEEKDGAGYTALGCALNERSDADVMEIAKYMAENNTKVFGINVPPSNWIPVIKTLDQSKWDLCRSLYPLTPLEYLTPMYGPHGAYLICKWLRAKEFDLALDLLRRYPRLCISEGASGWIPIMDLAGNQAEFLSGTPLGVWQKFIYNRLRLEHVGLNNLDTYITVPKEEADQDHQMNLIHSGTTLYRALVCSLLKLLGVNQLRKMKWMHTRSIDVLRCISGMLQNENLTSKELGIVKASVFKAVEHGHVEFVTHLCEAIPSLANTDQEDKNIFQFAVQCRQHKIYSLLYKLDKEDQQYFGERATTYPENMLHLAGNLSPLSRFNRIRGAALQMQRELQWFKEVEEIVPSRIHEISNKDGMTPRELFTKNHEKLKEDAEQSMKGTATSCTVVGALIVTIMFAVAFTVPGGTNGGTGDPMFVAEKLFLVFIISDTLSLVSSTTSVIVFLGILTSRYAEDDFMNILPVKMMVGLITLFISIASMMIAFCSALIMMLKKEYSWAIIPSICAAGIPVASFIWLQIPLLIEIFWSTYGPGIFDKKELKGEPWIKVHKES